MIRLAGPEDIEDCVRMGRRFFEAAEVGRWFDLDEDCVHRTMAFLQREHFLAVLDRGGLVGMIGALAYPCWFNTAHTTAQELFWWVDPDHRGEGHELLSALEAWALRRGCRTLEMICLDRSRPEALTRLYRRQGFEPKERTFVKEL